MTTMDFYKNNPLIHSDRDRSKSKSAWVRSFACTEMSPLIVCRGPIRKEAMDVFEEMGMKHYGILLSEKDSINYTHALAPELRQLVDPERIHRVPDYTGATKEERTERIHQIIDLAKRGKHDSIFAGYGFLAEDEEFVMAIEKAGLKFIGPCSKTVRDAGLKDEAKRTAQSVDVSVTPGVDNVTARTLLAKYPKMRKLVQLCRDENLHVDLQKLKKMRNLEKAADIILHASYEKGIDLFTIEELGEQIKKDVNEMFLLHPGCRIRLKAIGGGGGKGQRILGAVEKVEAEKVETWAAKMAAPAPGLAREILNEVKTNGVGDNKNILIEFNIESTRHNEIQLLGNGKWCIALGGRDCSLQMHEQKLLEVSITQEGFIDAHKIASEKGHPEAEVLMQDLITLEKMEAEAERFGVAVGLDSASTFECIVDNERHFFMEMNTRIQVEHRVTELCYALRFSNPDNPDDYFVVESLVEAMALLAQHKERLPRPTREIRFNASVEARLNATDQSLSPHAGGLIRFWSNPIKDEIRDDQGISLRNPDTGNIMKYKVAGAYDSNIALLVTKGACRRDSYERLAEILRRTKMHGTDLATNLEFHYGLVHWFLGQNVLAKPTTRFVTPYLTMVGKLKEVANDIDIAYAFDKLKKELLKKTCDPEAQKAIVSAFDGKKTLLLRPLETLMKEPHILSGWLSKNRLNFRIEKGHVKWLRNPFEIINETYDFLNMSYDPKAPAAEVIWKHDWEMLENTRNFYAKLREAFNLKRDDYYELNKVLAKGKPQGGFNAEMWQRIRASHMGFQLGNEILGIAFLIAQETGFFDLKVLDDLEIEIPEYLFDQELQQQMKKVLAPPPATKADEIVAVCGGMYYAQEGPGLPKFVTEGMHFEEGQPLYIIEVMKMFNKVLAPFSGTIDEIIMDGVDGTVVSKGQPLFKVTPDEKLQEIDPKELKKRKEDHTSSLMKCIFN
ncbi:MAG: biotin carboxylase [Acidobacteria bacterium]|nr:MAG: biotin carboxylase [Acidobacteriota bacterium]